MTMQTPAQPPEAEAPKRRGWYPDPERLGYSRYWNGSRWTGGFVRTEKSLDEPPNRVVRAGALLLLTPVAWFVAFAIADGLSQDGSRSAGQPWDAILGVLLVTFAASLPIALVGFSMGTLASAWRRPVEWLWLLPAATGAWLLWFLAVLGEDEPTRHTWWELAAMLVAAALVAMAVMRWPQGAWRWLLLTIAMLAALCVLLALVMAPMMA